MAIRAVWSPLNEVMTLRDAMDRLVSDSFINPRSMFNAAGGASGLAANLYETPEAYVVQVALPGADPEKVQITVQGEVVHLKGERKAPEFGKAQQIWNGISFGAFEQTFSLPTAVEGQQAEAQFENGLLSLHLPKVQNARAHTVKVTSGGKASQPVITESAGK